MTQLRMTSANLRAGRERLGLTVAQFAKALQMSAGELAAIEAERLPIPGPTAIAAQALFDGWRPPHMRAGPCLVEAA